MEFPIDIKNAIEIEAEKYKISDLILSAKSLTNKYKNESGKNERLVTSKIDVISYAIVRLPATFGALSFSLEQIAENITGNVDSVLDIGSGPGTSIIALNSLNIKPKKFVCVEREKAMIDFSKKFVSSEANYINADSTICFPKEKADLVIASYSLNELDKNNCFQVLDNMVEASNKYVLIVDTGTPEMFLRMKEIREYLLNKGLYILAPCAHSNKCPIVEGDWCHFTQRVARSRLHKLLKEADVPYEDEKFTFLAFSKSPVSNIGSRILRHPLITPGMIKLSVCNESGTIENVIITKKNKEVYKAAKKLGAGDKIEL